MQPVLHSFAYCCDFLRDQVAEVSETQMVAQPAMISNHAAWVLGHIIFSCQELGGVIGLSPWLPADWAQRYGTGSRPAADVTLYASKAEALALLSDAQARLTQAVVELTEAQLDQPFPAAEYRAVFPTIRHALTQVLVGHTAHHLGQLGVWRKALGLPGLGRHFE